MLFLRVLVIRENFRLYYLILFPDQDFLYQFLAAQLVLQLLRGHILAVGKDNQVLAAACDIDEIVLIHIP